MNAIKTEFRHIRKNRELWLLALPGVLLFVIFSYIPLYGLVLPFKNYSITKGFWGSPWAGVQNFLYLFNGDAWKITRNTIVFNAIFILLGLVVAVSFALILFEMSSRFVKVYQTILFIPFFLSWVVVSYVGVSVLDMKYGLLNKIIEALGGDAMAWYMVPKYWYVILPIANLWKGVGYGTIIYYTALMGVDVELYEAAAIDGATRLQQVRAISIPMLKPLMVMLTLMSIGGIIRADFGLFYSFTLDSKPLYAVTDVIDTYVFRALRQLGDVGMSSAAGLYQSLVGFILVLGSNWLVRRLDPENALF